MIALDLCNINKFYKIYKSPVDRLKEIFLKKPFHTPVVALNNINFKILHGETVGIIGENGAGKSTLLKILANTLKPTTGNLRMNGRVVALLELGAGFNPELTGEENIYLNAYLFGLSKSEVDSKKSEIIAFSELGEFIKRPVNTYSSGMYIRLAFSIAVSVDPSILLIDEALAVGDEYFRKKCVDRMLDFKKNGKTILFCSHSMFLVQQLCERAIWLHQGKIMNLGETAKIVTDYQNFEREKIASLGKKISESRKKLESKESKYLKIDDIKITNESGIEKESVSTFDPIMISFKVKCKKKELKGHIGFLITRNDNEQCFGTMTKFDGMDPIEFKNEKSFSIKFASIPLLPGLYSILVIVSDESGIYFYNSLRSKYFTIEYGPKELGLVYLNHEWLL